MATMIAKAIMVAISGEHGRTRTGTDKARASTGKRGQTRTGTDEEHFFFGGHDVLCLLYQVIAEKLNS
ncbi:MAG: hypothetical protein WCK47_15420 [bacterium]